MKIWVDTASGTWGEVDGDSGRLLIVDLDDAATRVEDDGSADAASLLAFLEGASDSEIVNFADREGRLAIPAPTDQPTLEELSAWVRLALPNAVWERDTDDGQLIIYTGVSYL